MPSVTGLNFPLRNSQKGSPKTNLCFASPVGAGQRRRIHGGSGTGAESGRVSRIRREEWGKGISINGRSVCHVVSTVITFYVHPMREVSIMSLHHLSIPEASKRCMVSDSNVMDPVSRVFVDSAHFDFTPFEKYKDIRLKKNAPEDSVENLEGFICTFKNKTSHLLASMYYMQGTVLRDWALSDSVKLCQMVSGHLHLALPLAR